MPANIVRVQDIVDPDLRSRVRDAIVECFKHRSGHWSASITACCGSSHGLWNLRVSGPSGYYGSCRIGRSQDNPDGIRAALERILLDVSGKATTLEI
jgi:hypothetical protein